MTDLDGKLPASSKARWLTCGLVILDLLFVWTGYGFVDYDSVQAAEAAVKALQANGVQAQMAKVGCL